MDHGLTWTPQMQYILESSGGLMRDVRNVCYNNWGPTYDAVMTVYRAVIESKSLYCCPVLFYASDRVLARLEAVKNQAMRLPFRLPAVLRLLRDFGR